MFSMQMKPVASAFGIPWVLVNLPIFGPPTVGMCVWGVRLHEVPFFEAGNSSFDPSTHFKVTTTGFTSREMFELRVQKGAMSFWSEDVGSKRTWVGGRGGLRGLGFGKSGVGRLLVLLWRWCCDSPL